MFQDTDLPMLPPHLRDSFLRPRVYSQFEFQIFFSEIWDSGISDFISRNQQIRVVNYTKWMAMRETRMCLTCEEKWCEDHECQNSCWVLFNPYDRDDEFDEVENQDEEQQLDEVEKVEENESLVSNVNENVISGQSPSDVIECLGDLIGVAEGNGGSVSSFMTEKGSKVFTYGDSHEKGKDLHLNGCPDEEEAAVLCSLGWDGNAGEDDGLIGEEINAFEEQEEKIEAEDVVLETEGNPFNHFETESEHIVENQFPTLDGLMVSVEESAKEPERCLGSSGESFTIDPIEQPNQVEFFVREFSPTGLACLMKSPPEPEIIKKFLIKNICLQGAYTKQVDHFTLASNVRPASFCITRKTINQEEKIVVYCGNELPQSLEGLVAYKQGHKVKQKNTSMEIALMITYHGETLFQSSDFPSTSLPLVYAGMISPDFAFGGLGSLNNTDNDNIKINTTGRMRLHSGVSADNKVKEGLRFNYNSFTLQGDVCECWERLFSSTTGNVSFGTSVKSLFSNHPKRKSEHIVLELFIHKSVFIKTCFDKRKRIELFPSKKVLLERK